MYRRFLEVSLDIPEFSLCIMGDRLVCAKSMEVRHLDDGYVLDLLYLADAIPSMVLSRLFR